MLKVLIPIILLLGIVIIKKIPYIGGNVKVALLAAGVSALLLGGIYNPIQWLAAWIDGFDRLSWVIWIALIGMIYAETQATIGTIDVVLDCSRSAFGHSPKGLYYTCIFVVVLFGSLLGEGLSAVAAVGVLCIPALKDLGLKPEKIAATLVFSALMGSLCPPMSNGIVLAASLCGADYNVVIKRAFITVPIVIVISAIFYAYRYVKIKKLPDNLIPKQKAGAILKAGWKKLIPMLLLLLVMILRYVKWPGGLNLDIVSFIFTPLKALVGKIPFISGLTNFIVMCLITVTVVALIYKPCRTRGVWDICKSGFKKFLPCFSVHVCCALMLGAFYAVGLIDVIAHWASTLNQTVLKAGGAASMALVGMVTGSQSTTQNTILSFFGPALVASGMSAEGAALAGCHLAMGAQAFPPTDLCSIVVAPLVASILGEDCDYVKTMMQALPATLLFFGSGVLLLFVLT